MPSKKDFREELEKLISKHEDSVLAHYIENTLKVYDHSEFIKRSHPELNPFGVDLTKLPETKNETPQPPQAIPANVGNTTTSGWSNPFGGTSWGV